MVCFYFIILIPLITATRRFYEPGYRSNIMERDKPILRMSPNEDYVEPNSDEGKQTISPPKTKDPTLVRDMNLLVNWLMENFGYDVVPMARKNNNDEGDDDEDDDKVAPKIEPLTDNPVKPSVDSEKDDDDDDDEDGVKVAPKIEITEPLPLIVNPVKPPVDSENSDKALRTKHKRQKHKEEEPNHKWVQALKEFIKDLTSHYGQHEVLKKAKPVIASLEKKHNVKIRDIDGEIHISYIEKRKGKKTARKRKKSDET